MDFLDSAIVRQIDKNYHLVSVKDVDLTNKDQELKLEKKTDYIIIEEHFIDRKGKNYSKRTAYDFAQLGEVGDCGYEEFVFHTFLHMKENGKVELVNLCFKR